MSNQKHQDYLIRTTKSRAIEWRDNHLIREVITTTKEGTVFIEGEGESAILSAIDNFISQVTTQDSALGCLTNATINAERTWFDYTLEFQKIVYPTQAKSVDIKIGNTPVSEARVTDNPPRPRIVKIFAPNLDGPIVQKFGMSDGTLSVEGFVSGYFSPDIGSQVAITAGDISKTGVVESCSIAYDPKLNETNISITISYQPA